MKIILYVLLLGCLAASPTTTVSTRTIRELFDALKQVESPNDEITGDDGLAKGPYQIHYKYWLDSGVTGTYQQCLDKEYAEQVITAYWKRYCPQALSELDFQTLSRTHNGGPNGVSKDSTVSYWNKVRVELDKNNTKEN